MRFLIFIASIALGFICIKFSKWITDHTGRMAFFETNIGGGGTYFFWKIFGLLMIVFSFYTLFGK